MEKSRALELLRPIVQSAQAPVLREYQPKDGLNKRCFAQTVGSNATGMQTK